MFQTNNKVYSADSLKLVQPFNCVIAGPTQCDKTFFLTELLVHNKQLCLKPIDRLVYCYGTWLPETFTRLKRHFGDRLELHSGFVESIDSCKFDPHLTNCIIIKLIIINLMTDAVKNQQISDLFTRGSHHRNLSVFLLMQNIFQQDKFSKTISDNAQYVVYFKNPRDQQQISYVSRQMSEDGKVYKPLIEAYRDATSEKNRGYIFLDYRTDQDDDLRMRTNILP